MAETRKLAAILPADVAGYSKLAGGGGGWRGEGGGAPGDQQKAATSAQRHGRGRQTAA